MAVTTREALTNLRGAIEQVRVATGTDPNNKDLFRALSSVEDELATYVPEHQDTHPRTLKEAADKTREMFAAKRAAAK